MVKGLKKVLFIVMLLAVSFLAYKTNATAASVVTGTCYCCGGSQGCSYTWKTTGSTIASNCAKATSKTKETCYGWNTSSGSGACWCCGGSQGCTYKWSSTGADPAGNCAYVSSVKSSSTCSGNLNANTDSSVDDSDDETSNNDDDNTAPNEDEETDGPDINVTFGEATCAGILGSGKFHQYLVDILNAIRIVGVAMVIVFSTMDFANALIVQDSEALKKAGQKSFQRLMIAIVIFFVPIILNILLALVGISGICI